MKQQQNASTTSNSGNLISTPGYCLSVDHALKGIVISVRGTVAWVDLLVSIQASPVPLRDCMEGSKHFGHRGIVQATNELLQELFDASRQPLFAQALNDYPDYSVFVTGHSMGGSIAALAAQELRRRLPDARSVQAVAFCPVPCVSIQASKAMEPLVTSIVNGDDLVCRLHVAALRNLTSQQNPLLYTSLQKLLPASWKQQAAASSSPSPQAHTASICAPTPNSSARMQLPGKLLHLRYPRNFTRTEPATATTTTSSRALDAQEEVAAMAADLAHSGIWMGEDFYGDAQAQNNMGAPAPQQEQQQRPGNKKSNIIMSSQGSDDVRNHPVLFAMPRPEETIFDARDEHDEAIQYPFSEFQSLPASKQFIYADHKLQSFIKNFARYRAALGPQN